MERPPLAVLRLGDSLSPALPLSSPARSIFSPGKSSISQNIITSTPTSRPPGLHCVNNSPFREWAKSNLSNFENESFSPSKGLLSPSYSHHVKLESPAIRAETKEDSTRQDTIETGIPRTIDPPFSPSFEHDFSNRDANEDEKVLSPKKEAQSFEATSLTAPSACNISSSASTWQSRFQFVDLFTFELRDEQVIACGFGFVSEATDSSFLRVRKQPATLPATPGFGTLVVGEDGSDPKIRVCSCKKSRCLKLYCECFAASELCKGCKCVDCANDGGHEAEREDAVERIKQRSINAFAPKIVEEVRQDKTMHARGCRCKKSHCLKKYCECYQAGVRCGDNCKCEECHNVSTNLGPSTTPRERRPVDPLRLLTARASSPGHTECEKSIPVRGCSRSPDEEDEDEECGAEDSPSPRLKRPRMLDFTMAATPTHHGGVLYQESPERRVEYGHYNMFGSPSSLFLPN